MRWAAAGMLGWAAAGPEAEGSESGEAGDGCHEQPPLPLVEMEVAASSFIVIVSRIGELSISRAAKLLP